MPISPTSPTSPDPPILTPQTAYADIINAAITGTTPKFAPTYRATLSSPSPSSLGLRALTSCDDRALYLIAEIATLEARARNGLDPAGLPLCARLLDAQLERVADDYVSNAFRCAAHIYLLSLLPGFDRRSSACRRFVKHLGMYLTALTVGLHPIDKGLAWVYIVGGAACERGASAFRIIVDIQMGIDGEKYRSFERAVKVLREVWVRDDAGERVEWRDVLRREGLEL